MKWSDDEYEAMIDLATRQLAERMAERALMTYEIYKYDYLDSQFVADFIAEFVISAYRSYLIKPENLDEEVMLLLFVNMAYENMRGLPDEVAQYHRLFRQLCDLYYEQGCLRHALIDEADYQKMDLDAYQKAIIKFDLNEKIESQNEVDFAFVDKVLGLSGEAGEVADKVKKVIRDQEGKLSVNDKKAIGQELGDILWYVATSARYLGISLEQIASENIEKLESRLSRGKISGSGDER